jgi:FkbM family methyltransferase
MREVLINGRWPLKLPEHRAARPEWDIANGGWEVERLNHMHQTIGFGDRVLYVGMEEADMCGLLASWGARVFMFEPNEAVWPNARAIWEANELPHPAGMFVGFAGRGNSDNWRDGYVNDDEWPECAYGPVIGDHGFKELCDPGERPIITIDQLDWPVEAIALDVEGSEWEVLQGAEQTLRTYKPHIYLSLHPESLALLYNKYSAEVRRWIMDLGYRETLLEWPLHEAHFYYEAL